MQNFKKLDMSSGDWLATHYRAKSAHRLKQLSQLPIKPGSKVLDICCGSGLFEPYLLDLVGPKGHVTGLDIDPVSLDSAHKMLSNSPHTNWNLINQPVDECFRILSDYDVVLLFNCICYFNDPGDLISKIASNLTVGSSVVIKDYDLESFFFTPRDFITWAKLIEAAKRIDATNNPISFSNFFGRNLHKLGAVFPFKSQSNSVWPQDMYYPFDKYEIEYIWRNIECLMKQADCLLDRKTAAYFKDQFYPGAQKFFEDKTSMFVEIEYVTILTT